MLGIDDAALAIMAGSLISTAGALYTNRTNLKAQQDVNDTNWRIAALNNATQIQMANSAHQREVADLRAAGLNPILSTGGNGSVTPNLTTAQGRAAQLDNPLDGIANGARELARYLSADYKAQVQQHVADASYAAEDASRLQRENAVGELQSKNDLMKASAEHSALHDLTHSQWQDSDGVWHDDFDPNSEYVREVKEGLMSDAKNRANQNWRANLGAFNSTANTAASILRIPFDLKHDIKKAKILKGLIK